MSKSLGVFSGDVPRVEAHTQCDAQTDAVVKRIVDVDNSRTREFQNLPTRRLDERRPRCTAFRLRLPEPGAGGLQPEFADGDWSRIREEIYQGRGT